MTTPCAPQNRRIPRLSARSARRSGKRTRPGTNPDDGRSVYMATFTLTHPGAFPGPTGAEMTAPLPISRTGAEILTECLEAAGVPQVFGLPGEENAAFTLALRQKSIPLHLTRHEQGAGFMAAGYGRQTGQPGICLATLGPGATNLLTAVADADMDHAPLIAIIGQASEDRRHAESHQVIDLAGLFEPVTKFAVEVRDPATIPAIFAKAWRIAAMEKPGAVVIILPEDVAGRMSDVPAFAPALPRRPEADDKALDAFTDRLSQARRPLIIAGNGAIRTRTSAALCAFCEATGIGVATTFMGKGCVPADADYHLFTLGLGQRDHIVDAIKDADMLIAVGVDLVEYPPKLWAGQATAELAHIDFCPAEIDSDFRPSVEVIGDIAVTLERTHARLPEDFADNLELDRQRQVRATILEGFADYGTARHTDDDATLVTPVYALDQLRARMDRADILVSGVGAHKMWTGRHFHTSEPNTVLIPNGFCAMGAGMGLAMGCEIACPERRVVALLGDGDFLMNVQEMETAARLGSRLVVVVWDDNAYGLIEWKQQETYGTHVDLSFGKTDWAALAQAFGWWCGQVKNDAALPGLLNEAFDQTAPALLVLPIDYSDNARLSKELGSIEMSQG